MSSEPENIGSRTDQAGARGDVCKQHGVKAFRRTVSLILIALLVAMGMFALKIARGHRTPLPSMVLAQNSANAMWTRNLSVFTPAHASFSDAFKEYIGWQPTPVQPIAFNHKIHLQNNVECTSCHESVTQGPTAAIPSVSFCMACHQAIAVDNPEIKKLTAYSDKGQEPPWQRVYWFYPERHVRFWHSPHIKAGVQCQECHGDLSQQTVAVRSKDLSMNFCLNCHRAKGVSVDCTTCHY